MGIIITADDFGLSPSTNTSIKKGIEAGVINSTNVMVNMPFHKDAVDLIKDNSELDLGIHLNLTVGTPISDPLEIASLVDDNGCFLGYRELKKRVKTGKIRKEDVRKELEAQVSEYRNAIGEPVYWNSHNHIHMLPGLYKCFVDVAAEQKIYIMRSNMKIPVSKNTNSPYLKNGLISLALCYARFKGMKFPSGMGIFSSNEDKCDICSYDRLLSKNSAVELIFHIAEVVDSDYFGTLKEQRILEQQFIQSDEFRRYIKNNGKSRFRDLQ